MRDGVTNACARLTAAVDGLAAESITSHTTKALGDDLVAIWREIDRLKAQFARPAAAFDRLQGPASEGATSTIAWLRGSCGLTGAAAAERVRLARVLDELPLAAASFSSGRAPFSSIAEIARLADTVGAEATRPLETDW